MISNQLHPPHPPAFKHLLVKFSCNEYILLYIVLHSGWRECFPTVLDVDHVFLSPSSCLTTEALAILVGQQNARFGIIKIFNALQETNANKHLLYVGTG